MYRQKTQPVEAFQLAPDIDSWPQWAKDARTAGSISAFPGLQGSSGAVHVSSPEGRNVRADVGDWIVFDGSFHYTVVAADAFDQLYEAVAD